MVKMPKFLEELDTEYQNKLDSMELAALHDEFEFEFCSMLLSCAMGDTECASTHERKVNIIVGVLGVDNTNECYPYVP